MRSRSSDILLYILRKRSRKIDADYLAEKYKITEKTLYNDLKEINDFLNTIGVTSIAIDSKGILTLGENFRFSFVKENLFKMDFYMYKLSSVERKLIVLLILIQNNEYTTMEKIANELYVSRITILSTIEEIKELLSKYESVKITSVSGKGIKLIYNEYGIRIFIVEIFGKFLTDSQNNYFQKLVGKKLSMKISFTEIVNLLQSFEKDMDILFSKSRFYDISLYITVAINRILDNHEIPVNDENIVYSNYENWFIKISHLLEKNFNINKKENEMIGLKRFINENNLTPVLGLKNNLEIYEIVTYFLSRVGLKFDVEFQNDKFLVKSLVDHLQSINNLSSFDFHLSINDSMKSEYDEINKEVEKYSYIIEKYLCFPPDENLRLSMTVHICASLIRNKTILLPLKVLVVCPGSMATGRLVEAQIKKYFNFAIENVIAVNKLNFFTESSKKKIDFVISTVELPSYNYPAVIVNPILKIQDLNKIQELAFSLTQKEFTLNNNNVSNVLKELEYISKTIENAQIDNFIKDLRKIIKKYNLQKGTKINNEMKNLLTIGHIRRLSEEIDWKQGIRLAGDILKNEGYIDDSHINEAIGNVLKYGPYIVISDGIALAHAKGENEVYSDGLSLVISKKGIPFGENERENVHMLFYFCTKGEDDYVGLFNQIIDLGRNKLKLEKILNSKNSCEVYSLLCK